MASTALPPWTSNRSTPIDCGGSPGLGLRALPYAFSLTGDQPPGDVRHIALDLQAPDGTRWRYGPPASVDVISGAAGEWCRVVTRRRRAEDTSLRASSPLGTLALTVARAYLAD